MFDIPHVRDGQTYDEGKEWRLKSYNDYVDGLYEERTKKEEIAYVTMTSGNTYDVDVSIEKDFRLQ